MANATNKVPSTTTPWGDDGIKRRSVDASGSSITYYPGAMAAVNGSGRGTKCDDTAGLTFDGIICNTVKLQIFDGDDTSDAAKYLLVARPFRFTMAIASASAATDIGKAVYAKYDNEVAFTSTNSILVGWVDAVNSATEVLVRPAYAGQRGNASFDGQTLTYTGSTGTNVTAVPDNLADAWSLKEGSNTYLTAVTTNSAERLVASKNLYQRGGNAPVEKLTAATITTAGAGTYTAANMLGGLILRDPNGGSRTDTTHTAAQIVAALPGAAVDDTFELVIVNTADAAETITLAGGTGVTLVPATVTIAQNEICRALVRLTNVTGSSEAVTVYAGNIAG